MRKTIMTMLLMFLSVVMMYGYADAISGVCSNCHTMHDSQNGAAVASGGPFNQLLNAGCVACHTAATAKTSTYGAPAVLHSTQPSGQGASYTNAGGDFYWVNAAETAATAKKGHNVIDLAGVTAKDTNMPNLTPPGWAPAATTGFTFADVADGEAAWTSQLTCAGKYGCHGSHTNAGSFEGVNGAHHNNSNGQLATASTVGNSFRFLGGIKGLENADWNWGETATTHNEYYGVNYTADRSAGANYGSKDTISFLCAECHGVFHATIDADATSGTPWVRHPTDINLPDSGGYDDYNSDNGDNSEGNYSLEAPVARPTVPATSSATVVAGGSGATGAIVMCLSCHRAHGSPEDDLLRWTYSSMVAGGGNTTSCLFY
ncbi:MAG: hypothetical protein HY757_05590 [Nitrospirae bacterium]|nr:hypothetical protein [Nitrospirota bacterium]